MSLAQIEFKIALRNIVDALKIIAGPDDMASVQINTDGKCILRSGIQHSEHLSIDDFAREIDQAVSRHLGAGGTL